MKTFKNFALIAIIFSILATACSSNKSVNSRTYSKKHTSCNSF